MTPPSAPTLFTAGYNAARSCAAVTGPHRKAQRTALRGQAYHVTLNENGLQADGDTFAEFQRGIDVYEVQKKAGMIK